MLPPCVERGWWRSSSAAWGCGAGASPTRDLALRHVVLYQNGVAYFERTGALDDGHVKLQFKEREVDDVLKTLVVVEQGAAKGAKPPTVTTRLAQQEKAVDPNDATALEVVISPRPTAPISTAYAVPSAAWKSTYRIVLPQERGASTALLQAWALVDNVSDEDWTGVALSLATGAPLTFSTHLREPLFVARPDAPRPASPTAMGPVVADRSQVDSDGDGIPDALDKCPDTPGAQSNDGRPEAPRKVVVSERSIVINERIGFARDSDAIAPASKAALDAFASVLRTNPSLRRVEIQGHTSQDEKGGFALASRRASAVHGALVARGVGAVELIERALGDAMPIASNDTEQGRAQNRRVSLAVLDVAEGKSDFGGRPSRGVVTQSGAAASARVEARIAEAGGSYRYDLTNAVTIPRKSSSMVTIVNDNVPGEEILLYRPDANVPGSDRAPLRAARLENKTAAGFPPGPVAIFAGGTFVGEGLLDRLNPGDTTYIPYGVDPASTVRVETKGVAVPARVLAIKKGVMTVEDTGRVTTRYEATIGHQAPARLFVRHARRAGYLLGALPNGSEHGAELAFAFVPVPLTPGKAAVLTIEETRTEERTLALLDVDAAQLEAYVAGSKLAPDVATRLRAVAEQRREIGRQEVTAQGIREQLGELAQRAGELRESLRAVERTPRAGGLQKELLDRLTETTKRSEALAGELATTTSRREAARAKLVETLRELALERPKASATL